MSTRIVLALLTVLVLFALAGCGILYPSRSVVSPFQFAIVAAA